MMEMRSPEDLYPKIEELILRLKREGLSKPSAILDHRMHLSWTTWSELFEELQAVLRSLLDEHDGSLNSATKAEITRLLSFIDGLLDFNERQHHRMP